MSTSEKQWCANGGQMLLAESAFGRAPSKAGEEYPCFCGRTLKLKRSPVGYRWVQIGLLS